MEQSLKKNTYYSYVIFLISPIISFFLALGNPKALWAKNIVWFFVVFYAVSFSIPSQSSDAYRYKETLELYYRQEIPLADFIANFYTSNVNLVYFSYSFDDVIQPTLSYLVALFTDNYRVLYFFVGIIFGYFYSRNIWALISHAKDKIQPLHIFIILAFALIIPFWNLNSIRMWTAAHIFFFGIIQYIEKKNLKVGLAIIGLSALMHFSFLLPIFTFCLYIVFGNRMKIYFILFLISFFTNEIDVGTIRTLAANYLPAFLQANVETYTPEEIIVNTRVKSWHAVYYQLVLKWTVFVIMVMLYYYGKDKIKTNLTLFNLFCFTLLILSVAQVSSLFPSGGRFLKVADLFALMSLFYFVQNFGRIKVLKKSLFYIAPGLVFFCLVSLRLGMDSINVSTLGNIFSLLIFGSVDLTIMDIIS